MKRELKVAGARWLGARQAHMNLMKRELKVTTPQGRFLCVLLGESHEERIERHPPQRARGRTAGRNLMKRELKASAPP